MIPRLARLACGGMPRITQVPDDSLERVYQQNHFMMQEDVLLKERCGEEESMRCGPDAFQLSVTQVLEGMSMKLGLPGLSHVGLTIPVDEDISLSLL